MPPELVSQFLSVNPDSLGVSMRTSYQKEIMFDDMCNVDICPVATVKQIITDRVPVIFPVVKQDVPVSSDIMVFLTLFLLKHIFLYIFKCIIFTLICKHL